MNQLSTPHPASPLLDHCPETLHAGAYYDPAWHERELREIWAKNWIYVGRDNGLPEMTMRRVTVAGQNLILLKNRDGTVTCFHNTCRHRGAELCAADENRLHRA